MELERILNHRLKGAQYARQVENVDKQDRSESIWFQAP